MRAARSKLFRFWVTDGELKQLFNAAHLADAPSASEWVRSLALREAERVKARKRSEASRPGIAKVLETTRTQLATTFLSTMEGQ
jgi:hypothetical protein